mmetsp:Transcript_60109/g.68408  ORF Transcript_60109/g.68408 Transcript_60109/m.68408 type:complete len:654 (+) Transcript_60109:17-1978(+)
MASTKLSLWTLCILFLSWTTVQGTQPEFERRLVDTNLMVDATKIGRRLASGDYQPIRVLVDDEQIRSTSSLKSSQKSFLLNDVLPMMKKWIEERYKVIPVDGKITLTVDKCLSYRFPSRYSSSGVDDTDLIIFATAESISSSAKAGSCFQDSTTKRPLAGRIVFNPSKVDPDREGTWYGLALHEATHLMGFISGLFEDFIDPDTNQPLGVENVYKVKTIKDKERHLVILPKVVEAAREHFCCDSLEGLELEDYDSDGPDIHWDERVLWNEYMTSIVESWNQQSKLTLALMEGSGWYKVDMTKADNLLYGKCLGCDFVEEKCMEPGNPPTTKWPEYFCVEDDARGCSFNRLLLGKCYVTKYSSSLPDHFRYFTKSTRYGGKTEEMDYCPTLRYYSGDCLAVPDDWDSSTKKYYAVRKDTRGEKARCFPGSWVHNEALGNKSASSWLGEDDRRVSCLNVDCRESKLFVSIGEVEIECPNEGGDIDLSSYDGVQGVINCPKYDVLCPLRNFDGNIIDDGGVTQPEEEEEDDKTEEEEDDTSIEPAEFKPIRIKVDDSQARSSSLLTSSQQTFLLDEIIPAAKEWLEKVYRVLPAKGKLVMETEDCEGAEVPEQYLSSGAEEIDFLLLITIDTSSATATTGTCQQDPITRRPVAGRI